MYVCASFFNLFWKLLLREHYGNWGLNQFGGILVFPVGTVFMNINAYVSCLVIILL